MKNKFALMAFLFLLPGLSFAQKSTENLSNLMGAINQVIGEKTQVDGVKDSSVKITPPAQNVFKTLTDDLELCQTTKTTNPEVVKVEKDGVSVQFKKFDLRIYGDKCPLELLASLNATQQTDDALEANFVMKLVFKTDSYIQKYKMKNIEVSGNVSAKAVKTGNVVHLPVLLKIASHGESTDLGYVAQEMSFAITMDVDTTQFNFNVLTEQNATLQFGDQIQKGYSRSKISGFTQAEVLYTLNDKEVSESEYQVFLQSFVLPGTVSADDPNAPDGKVLSQCTFVAYDKKNISAAILKDQMQKSTLQTDGLLARGQSCMNDVSIPFQQGSENYTGQLSFGKEWISFSSAPKNKPSTTAPSVFVLYKDTSVQTHETENLVMGLQCQVVTVCP